MQLQQTIMTAVGHRLKASFPVRRLSFDFRPTARYWAGQDPFLTHLFNGMSGIFPQGELYLIETLRQLRGRISDPVLQAEISSFIGQEAMHAKEHLAFNRYADQQGINIASLERYVNFLYRMFRAYLPPMHNMAIGCAVEHITATLGAELLRRDDLNRLLTGPVGELWLWHALEENEHKAVYFDAYQALGGHYALRALWMAVAGSAVMMFIGYNMTRLLYADRQLTWSGTRNFIRLLFGAEGLVSNQTRREWLDYFSRDFHPNDHDSLAIQQIWRERLALA